MGNVCCGSEQQKFVDIYAPSSDDLQRYSQLTIDLSRFQFHKKGRRIEEDYKIGRVLNRGAFGEVRQCELRKTKARRAVKIMTKAELSVEHVKEFQNEINLLAQVEHPNIIKVYGSYECARRYYIVTDLYQGGELFDLVTDADLEMSEAEAAGLMKQLLTAVNVCHAKGIMHRDIKPENIMLHSTKKNEPRKIFLIDFGTAIQYRKGCQESDFAGTAYYVAPEVIHGAYDEKCDVWSCGMIAHLLLTKQLPFDLMEMEEEGIL